MGQMLDVRAGAGFHPPMTDRITIWHNPSCSTSRKALDAIRAAGHAPEVIRYLDTGWTAEGLGALLAEAGLAPSAALRRKGDLARDLGLLDPEVAEEAILQAMLKHPVLIERPFVRTPRGTVLARPLERLTDLLARS
jgi:arsenate reductase